MNDDRATWEMLAKLNTGGGLSHAGAKAVRELLDRIAGILGQEWPETQYQQAGQIPSELLLLSSHRYVLPQFLAFALRLSAAATEPTFKPVLPILRAGVNTSMWRHILLQLEVARACRSMGVACNFEPDIPGSLNKADLQITGGRPSTWMVETTTVLRGDRDKNWEHYEDQFVAMINAIERRHGVTCVIHLEDHLDTEATSQWIAAVETAAASSALSRTPQTVEAPAGSVQILMDGPDPGAAVFTGAPQDRNGWTRLRRTLAAKGRQTNGPVPIWIRVDAMDGFFQFTPWANDQPAERLDALATAVKQITWPNSTYGVVISTGQATALSATDPVAEDIDLVAAAGTYTRRLIAPRLVRETFVITLSTAAMNHTALWTDAYRTESDWLTADLAAANLPLLADFWQT